MHSGGGNRRSCGSVSRFGHPRINARLPASRGLSQAAASFVASRCQDIHRTPLRAWPRLPIAVHHWAALHPTRKTRRAGRTSATPPGRGGGGRCLPTVPTLAGKDRRPAGNGPTIAKKGARRRPPDGKHCSGATGRGNGRHAPRGGDHPGCRGGRRGSGQFPSRPTEPRHRWADRPDGTELAFFLEPQIFNCQRATFVFGLRLRTNSPAECG